MAIRVSTGRPNDLLGQMKKAINSGKIQTWAYDSEGDFTHTPGQWVNRAWLRPVIQSGALILNILAPRGVGVSTEVYGVYHGRFIEMLLVHFDGEFSDAAATAAVAVGDNVSA